MKLDSHQVVFVLRVEHIDAALDEVLGGLELSETASISTCKLDILLKNKLLYHIHDLRRGKQFTFVSWQEIQDYIKENTRQGLR